MMVAYGEWLAWRIRTGMERSKRWRAYVRRRKYFSQAARVKRERNRERKRDQ